MANLANNRSSAKQMSQPLNKGIKYCRTCYDHLAGHIGVTFAEAMEQKAYLKKSGTIYLVTAKGWNWFNQFDISPEDFTNSRRPLTRQCLDWSERRPHLAGQLGALLLEKMLQRKWFKKVQFSRELVVTVKGRQEVGELLGVSL